MTCARCRVDDCLHLKSAITEVAPGVVVLNPEWVDGQMFADHAIIEVDPSEPAAANVLSIGDVIVSVQHCAMSCLPAATRCGALPWTAVCI